ncbi:NADPH-dependent FMN reductase [Thermophilibacter immobilis]|jgi:chromate reductase|uniref:NAD(P)H-dependent oxidoreductase n=1 Tax=Thermophilibacter immobilis TaxID=2779519 RepID=A0A7S7RUQ7_9ACTN|nr:NAD(P)H-dependent oxidoreductase [Thermophilibacter immobilis]QOY60828.1 NAD(P)H-dependent oxidoreductase [Thermophilibacter immobilis]
MSEAKKIGVLVGSLRKASFSRAIAREIVGMAPEGLDMSLVDIDGLPIFNQDYDDEGRTPQSWVTFREKVASFDGFLFVTPEYNRSIPPVLKNALDVASRPYGQNVWAGKPSGIVSVSPGSLGGFGANHHLRQVMMFLDVPMLQQPEAYVREVASLLDDEGRLTDESTRSFLGRYVAAFDRWVHLVSDAR